MFSMAWAWYNKIAKAILLQKTTKVYHKMCQVFYYKMQQFSFKMWQLQIVTILLQNGTVITKCDIITNCDTDSETPYKIEMVLAKD